MELKEVFEKSFDQYSRKNPIVLKVKKILEDAGEELSNDHIAIRTWNRGPVKALNLAEFFINHGYEIKGKYDFKEKNLKAIHLEKNNNWPKVFISELLLEKFPKSIGHVFENLKASVEGKSFEELFLKERPWSAEFKVYNNLLKHSEYASWVYAHGFSVNHFTILVNKLKGFDGLVPLNNYLLSKNIALNGSGGLVKGSPEVLLEQSSTIADEVEVIFDDGKFKVPGCYYEFALRYPDESGNFFQGFIENSADKIFESTNK